MDSATSRSASLNTPSSIIVTEVPPNRLCNRSLRLIEAPDVRQATSAPRATGTSPFPAVDRSHRDLTFTEIGVVPEDDDDPQMCRQVLKRLDQIPG